MNLDYIESIKKYFKVNNDLSFLFELYKIDCMRKPHDRSNCIIESMKKVNHKQYYQFMYG